VADFVDARRVASRELCLTLGRAAILAVFVVVFVFVVVVVVVEGLWERVMDFGGGARCISRNRRRLSSCSRSLSAFLAAMSSSSSLFASLWGFGACSLPLSLLRSSSRKRKMLMRLVSGSGSADSSA
jgi:hypothetical protein